MKQTPPSQPTLHSLVNKDAIKNLLADSLYEKLGVKGTVRFSDLGWQEGSPGHFINSIAQKITDQLAMTGEKIAREKFKNFDPNKTKLDPELVAELWRLASDIIAEQIEGLHHSKNQEINGLEQTVRETPLLPDIDSPYKMHTSEFLAYSKSQRQKMLDNLPTINHSPELLEGFRNNLFKIMQDKFGLYKEQEGEIKRQLR